jgi:hypothetical protein
MILANTANSQHPTCPSQSTPGGSCILGKFVATHQLVATTVENLQPLVYVKEVLGVLFINAQHVESIVSPMIWNILEQYCNYNPNGCPDSTDPEIFIDSCFCDPALKIFLCTSFAMLPCNSTFRWQGLC